MKILLAVLAALFMSCAAAMQPCTIDGNIPTIEDGITEPRVIQRTQPIPPRELLGHPRVATVEVAIGTDGRVQNACLMDGDPQWGAVVRDAVRHWVWEPATKNGQPIAVRFPITSRME